MTRDELSITLSILEYPPLSGTPEVAAQNRIKKKQQNLKNYKKNTPKKYQNEKRSSLTQWLVVEYKLNHPTCRGGAICKDRPHYGPR